MSICEILAPVGASEQLLAAVRCGANAVYLGGKNFNARRNAANFGDTDLTDAVRYCHARNVKVYVTVNTVVTDAELDALTQEADDIAASGADAVIVQDMAVLRLFRERYPTLARYASTQTAVHNVDGARFLRDVGFDSIVLARELTLNEMETICTAVDLKTEAFIHGAHCMSVSGACYLSAMLGGRSGNRGLCAQPCRLDWHCGARDYALSLKDMSLIPHIRQMAEIGVDSFKIEGRMKRPEYVAAAVTACRKALAGEAYDTDMLRAVFSRSGFTDGYLTGKRGADMFGYRTREDVADAESVLKSLAAEYRSETPLVAVDMRFTMDAHASHLTVDDGTRTIAVTGDAPQAALTRPLDEIAARKNLTKTGGTPYYVRDFAADLAEGYMLPAAALNAMRRDALDTLCAMRGETLPHAKQPFSFSVPARYASPRETPALWARFYDPAQAPDAAPYERVLLPVHRITREIIDRYGGKLVAELPAVLFPCDEPAIAGRLSALRREGLTDVFAGNIYGVTLGKRLGLTVHGGFGLNVTNTEALDLYAKQGVADMTVSFELAMAKIRALGGSIPRGVVSYGRLPLMHFRNCPVRAAIGCGDCGENGVLTDRLRIDFPVECGEKRYAALLNSVPLDVADKDLHGLDHQLLYFTRESALEAAAVTKRFLCGVKTDAPHTGGLYYRELL